MTSKKVFTLIRSKVACGIKDCYLLRFDGGSVPNPGTCGSGAVIYSPGGVKLWETGRYMDYGTNNAAEYTGLEIGLLLCLREGYLNVKIEGDSKLVISQVCGLWAVKSDSLRNNYDRVIRLLDKFNYVAARHIYREFNADADALTNELQGTRCGFERKF